jgi:hypothetical protein
MNHEIRNKYESKNRTKDTPLEQRRSVGDDAANSSSSWRAADSKEVD